METADCVFCKIVSGEIPSEKVWEDDEFLAILDVNPNTLGMSILMTKSHYDSYLEEMPDELAGRFLVAAKKVGRLLDQKLGSKRTAMVLEGIGVNHAHIKLYPMHGLGEKFPGRESDETVFYKQYPGFITTKRGPQAPPEELKKIKEKIRGE